MVGVRTARNFVSVLFPLQIGNVVLFPPLRDKQARKRQIELEPK